MKSTRLPFPALTACLAMSLALPFAAGQSILNTAGDFVLLAGTAVSVGGAGPDTFSNGNVGAQTGISGFPPATVVNGSTILGGSIVNSAINDLITARNNLSALSSPPANNLSGINGGNLDTQILTPGVYKFDVAATLSLNGVLTLDAQGKNNVVWVFNIGTSLITGANAQVKFVNLGTNGGMDDGLFWNTGSEITVGANNVIAGNYISGTSVTIGTTDPLSGTSPGSGRALALAGVSFDGQATMNVLGGPGSGDFTGGLALSGGALVPSGYVLLSSDGVYTQGLSSVTLSPGHIYNTPGVTIDGGSADALLVPATLTVFNTTATLTGTNTYTGGTIVDGGTLITGSANLPANRPVSLIDSNATGTPGALVFDQSTDGTFGGVISGAGSLTKQNTGALTLTGVNTYTGGTVVNAGSLVASTATLPTTGGVALAAGSTLVLDETSAATYGDTITGGGTLQKQGVGALTLTNTTDSLVDLQAGSLYMGTETIAGGLGATTVASGALLGGNGTITGDLINNGTVSPGFSPGVIVVAGNYTQNAGGTLVIQFASALSYDQLVIGGTASLAGTLQVDLLNGYNPAGQSFQILTSVGGVTGTFAAVTGSAALTANITYNPNDVTVAFTQTAFNTFAGTPNQVSVANAAQADPAITAALNLVPLPGQLQAAFNALSPQGYEVWSDIAFSHATSLTDRLAANDNPAPGREHYYFEAGQRRGLSKGDADVGSSKYDTNSGLVGGNYGIGPNLTLGGFFEYAETSSGLGSAGSDTNIKDKMFGLRAAWHQDRWFAHAVLATGFEDYKSTRSIVFPGTAAVATSSTNGHTWLADISGGRDFSFGPVTVSPFVGVLATRWDADGFTETGAGAFNNTVGSQTARSLRTQLGVENSLDLKLGTLMLRPHVRAAWLHELGDDQRTMDAALGGTNYAITTRKPQRDSALLAAGLDLALNPNTMLYTDVSVQTGGTSRVMGEWRAGLSIGF